MQRIFPLIRLYQPSLLRKTCNILFMQQKGWPIKNTIWNWYSSNDQLSLNVDTTAAQQLQEILKDAQFLRVMVEGGGCSGFQYKFEIDTDIDAEEDMIFERNGMKVVSDIESVKILNGATIDYHKDLIRSGFRVVDIKQAEKGCSCGVSFSIKL